MKKFISAFLSLTLLSTQVGAFEGKTHDLIVNTQLNYDWSSILVNKIRRYMKINDMGDPFNARFQEAMVIKADLAQYLNEDSQDLMQNLGDIIGLNLLKTSTQFTIEGMNYKIDDFKTDLKTTEQLKDGISLAMDFSAADVKLGADKIVLGIVIPGKEGKKSPVLNIEIVNPQIQAAHPDLVNFFAKIKIQDNTDHFKLLIENTDFENMAEMLLKDPDSISFKYDLIVPPVQIKIGNKSLDFSPEKIKALLIKKEKGLKGLLLAQFAAQLGQGMGEKALKVMETYKLKKDYWIDAEIQTAFKLLKFNSDVIENYVEIVSRGDFCTTDKFKKMGINCTRNPLTPAPASRLTDGLHRKSLEFMKELINRNDAAVVVTASEDYINKLLVSTFDAGLWTDTLKEYDFELGPGKMVARMDQEGDTFTLYLDVIKKLKGAQRLALGAQVVRFPLSLKTSIKIENKGRTPIIIVKAEDVDLSDELILNGRPDLGMESNISGLRMKKKVLETLKKEVSAAKGKILMDLSYPEIRGMGLENTYFKSDGTGRMHAYLRLIDLTEGLNQPID
jgi:hypothetical protein